MKSITEIVDEKGQWVFVIAVSGLSISKEIGEELTINKITFVSKDKLKRIRKRLNFPWTIKELKERFKDPTLLEESEVYAIGSFGGVGTEKEQEFLKFVKEELAILSLSQLGYGRRRSNAALHVSNGKRNGSLKYLAMNKTKLTSTRHFNRSGRFHTLELDKRWLSFHKKHFFFELLSLLKNSDSTIISDNWKLDIKNAAILAGQSQSSTELEHAFLWNVIAIETLLAKQGDSYSSALPLRVEAFIGWTTAWSLNNFSEKIVDIYKKRSAFVHAGRIDSINLDDLLFTDKILLNVLHNILKHINLFKTKDDLIMFSRKVEAEHTLGIVGKTRPKTTTYIDVCYIDQDFKSL